MTFNKGPLSKRTSQSQASLPLKGEKKAKTHYICISSCIVAPHTVWDQATLILLYCV